MQRRIVEGVCITVGLYDQRQFWEQLIITTCTWQQNTSHEKPQQADQITHAITMHIKPVLTIHRSLSILVSQIA